VTLAGRASLALLVACSWACGEPPSPRDQCKAAAWYPGVTDKSAPHSRVTVHLVSEMHTVYPDSVCLLMDGQALLSDADQEQLRHQLETVPASWSLNWSGTVAPGDHTFTLFIRWLGHGYMLDVKSAHSTTAASEDVTVTATMFEVDAPVPERPKVRWTEARPPSSNAPSADGGVADSRPGP
jgi:hypothetical protein